MVVNGIIVPLITFFNEKFKLNRNLNTLLISHVILNNANALYLFGTAGEGKYFTENFDAYSKQIKLSIKLTEVKIPVLAGTYGNGENEVIDQLEQIAKEFSSVSFVISPPMFKKLSIADLRSYFETILGSINFTNDIYLYNNPTIFSANIIDPNVLNWLLSFSNLSGIIDASDKLNNYKKYIELLSDAFSVCCGKEGNFSKFLQLVPKEKRHLVGLVPSISNITNICAHLYNASLIDDTLQLIQIQEQINDIRKKIYDVTQKEGKYQRGIKLAFKTLYEDIISADIDDCSYVSSEYQRTVENSVIDRINATTKSLENDNYIKKFYIIGKKFYEFNQLSERLSSIDELSKFGTIKRIKGPYESKINTTYRLKIDVNDLVFRARVSKAFRYEDIVKEKILYPFLDNNLSNKTDLREEIKKIITSKRGSYNFNADNPPLVPVGNLVYYDETKEIIPYLFTVQEYIKGKPLYDILEKSKNSGAVLNSNKYLKLFNRLGEILANIHEIRFDTFYEKVTDIGKNLNYSWSALFQNKLDNELQIAKKNKVEFITDIKDYIRDNVSLLEEENEPVIYHNDFHAHNIIVKEDINIIKVNGLIDFDNWQIGVRAQDFAKFQHLTLKPLDTPELEKAFYQGYIKASRQLIKDIQKKIDLYSILWFLKAYNFEKDKIRKSEQKHTVDGRFPAADTYLFEMKRILGLL